jgi:hypothetical protein
MNSTEEKIVKVIDEFIVYMLTENDAEQIIYSKLNELDGDELDEWVNDELRHYLGDNTTYTEQEQEVDSMVIYDWYENEGKDICEVFSGNGDIMSIQREVCDFYIEDLGSVSKETLLSLFCNEDLLREYTYMYIFKMPTNDLKEYIINLIDPIEPK